MRLNHCIPRTGAVLPVLYLLSNGGWLRPLILVLGGSHHMSSVDHNRFRQKFAKFAPLGVACALGSLLLTGCGRQPLISVNLLNRTGGACQSASVDFNGKSEDLNANVPNGDASISGGWPYPMPRTATLRWVTEDRTPYSATLTVPPAPPGHADFLDYEFVLLPRGRANVAVLAQSGSTEGEAEQAVAVQNDLGRDGGPSYRVAVKNAALTDLHDVDVRFGQYAVNAGTSFSGSGQNYSIATGLPYPVTTSALVRWTTKDGHAYTNIVSLTNLLPSDLNDKCFWFILREQGDVTAQVVGWSDLRAGKHPELCRGF
jgi:hypothetical protein